MKRIVPLTAYAAVIVACAHAVRAADVPSLPADAAGTAASRPAAGAKSGCTDCAVIRTIRPLERERATRREMPSYMTSPQYLDTRRYSEPYVGPVLGITFGPGQETKTFVGAAGSPAMRQRILQISYEVLLRYDDGRSGLIEIEDASSFRVGDRVKVVNNQLELLPQEH